MTLAGLSKVHKPGPWPGRLCPDMTSILAVIEATDSCVRRLTSRCFQGSPWGMLGLVSDGASCVEGCSKIMISVSGYSAHCLIFGSSFRMIQLISFCAGECVYWGRSFRQM